MKKMSRQTKIKIALIILPIFLFAFLAVYIQAGYSTHFEDRIYLEAVEHMSPILTNILKFFSWLGGPIVIVISCLTLLLWKKSRLSIGIPISLAVTTAEIFNIILKQIFARERPDILRLVQESSYSFPSGHAMANTALYTMLGLLVLKYVKNGKLKGCYLCLCLAIPLIIGFSRIYLGVHFAGDVVGGFLLGFATAILVYLIMRKDRLEEIKLAEQEDIANGNITK